MSVSNQVEQRVWAIIDKMSDKDKTTVEQMFDLIQWGFYGQKTLSQFGYGLSGWVFRQHAGSVRCTVKVSEGGIPLVGFITSATTIGCIEQMFDLLENERLTWQKDKYPWI